MSSPCLAIRRDFVLRRADDDRHVGLAQPVELLLQRRALDRVGCLGDALAPRAPASSAQCALHLVVHAHRGRLVDRDEHRLAAIAAAGEMAHQVGGDLVEPVLAGDEVVLPGEAPRERVLFVLVQIRPRRCTRGDLVAQFLVRELQLGHPVLVIERHRRAVVDRLGEVVDRDVIAEHLAGALFLAGDQRRAGEADEGGVRQRLAHVRGENVVLAAMGLVGDDDDVAAGRQLRIDFAARRPEFLDEGEDVALVAAQQLLQVLAALRLHGLAQLRELARRPRRFRRSGRRVRSGR